MHCLHGYFCEIAYVIHARGKEGTHDLSACRPVAGGAVHARPDWDVLLVAEGRWAPLSGGAAHDFGHVYLCSFSLVLSFSRAAVAKLMTVGMVVFIGGCAFYEIEQVSVRSPNAPVLGHKLASGLTLDHVCLKEAHHWASALREIAGE
eukprot:1157328-Pelagomonas_calceolata.AAC.2